MPDGRQQTVGLRFAPDFLGRPFAEASDVSAKAASTVRLRTFPRSTLEDIVRRSPAREHRLHRQALAADGKTKMPVCEISGEHDAGRNQGSPSRWGAQSGGRRCGQPLAVRVLA